MGKLNLFNFSALFLSVTVGFYTGVNFFQPIVVERLRKDGNLRRDMSFPEYDENGDAIIINTEENPSIIKDSQLDKQSSQPISIGEEVQKELEK